MRLRDLGLKAKQRASFGVVVVIMASVNFYTIHEMRSIKSEIDEVSHNWLPRAIAIADINLNTSRLRINQLQQTLTLDPSAWRELSDASIALIEEIEDNIDIYDSLRGKSEEKEERDEQERTLFLAFDDRWDEYAELSADLFELLEANQHREARALLNGDGQEIFSDLSAHLVRLVDVTKRDSFRAAERAEETFVSTRRIAILLLIATTALSAFIAGALAHLITVPITALERASGEVAGGDLDVQLTVHSKDEIGRLARSFNQMTVALKQAKEKTESQAGQLRSQNEELQNAMRELRDTQEQLLLREKMASLGDLVAGVAHEMNTPIGTATSAGDVSIRCVERLETMLREAESIEAMRRSHQLPKVLRILRDSVRVSRDAGDRIGAIVQSLKNFARLDEAEYQEADIHEGLDSTLTLMNAELKERVTVNKRYGEIPRIVCNPGQLNQVFLNVLKNAADAIETAGTIDVATFEQDGQVHVEISDTGRGIPRNRLDRLFDFGFSAVGSRVKMTSGLSTAYSIIQKHHGEIDIDSEVGKGTRVSLILPTNRG